MKLVARWVQCDDAIAWSYWISNSKAQLLMKYSGQFFLEGSLLYSPSKMEALALWTSLSTVFLNSLDSFIRTWARETSPKRGRPRRAIFSSSVRSSGDFCSAIAANPASAVKRRWSDLYENKTFIKLASVHD